MPSLFSEAGLRPLRERQSASIEAIRQAVIEGHKRIVVQAPCGFGKTITAAHIITRSLAKGKRSLFTVPSIALVNQTLAHFEREGISDIGIIQSRHERTDWLAQVQIASVQTLIRRALPEVDFVLVDEAHNQFDKLNERLDSDEWKDKVVIGLTATPWAKGMGIRWTKLIIAATVSDLIGEGFLSPFIVYAPADENEPDLTKVKISKGEFEEKGLHDAMDKPQLVADIVKTWQEKGQNLPTFLFAVDCAHAKSLRDEFERVGINCGYIDAFSDDEDRKETFRRFRNGDDKIIASVGCLTTGVDEDVRVIIDAAPTRSEIRHVQKIGRGLRTADGKDKLIILDHAGNTIRLGLVTDIYHDHLDTREKGERGEAYSQDKKPKKPRKCLICYALIPPGSRKCHHCGTNVVNNSKVQSSDGELVLWGSGKQGKMEKMKAFLDSKGLRPLVDYGYENMESVARKHGYTDKKVPTMAEKQEWYSGLLWIAHERKYSEGWAAHKYKEKFGVWPNQLKKEPAEPSQKVRSFEHHLRIKYAKSKNKSLAPS